MNKKIIKQLEDKEFVKELLSKKEGYDVKKFFKSKGIEISNEELIELGEILSAVTERVKSITKDDLEKIAGSNVPFSDYFKKAGEYYGVHQGRIPPIRGPWYKLGFGGTPGSPATPGDPVGNFLYDNANELALTSIAGATVVAALAAMYTFEKAKGWYQNSNKES